MLTVRSICRTLWRRAQTGNGKEEAKTEVKQGTEAKEQAKAEVKDKNTAGSESKVQAKNGNGLSPVQMRQRRW